MGFRTETDTNCLLCHTISRVLLQLKPIRRVLELKQTQIYCLAEVALAAASLPIVNHEVILPLELVPYVFDWPSVV